MLNWIEHYYALDCKTFRILACVFWAEIEP